MSILNFNINSNYKTPNITILEKDFSNVPTEDIKKYIDESNYIYKAIFYNNKKDIEKYLNLDCTFFNFSGQTPLMFASKLNNVEYVKLLIKEHGRFDSHNMSAYDYTTNEEIKNILKYFEYYEN